MKLPTISFAFLSILSTAQCLFIEPGNFTTLQNATAIITSGILDYYAGTQYGGTIGTFQEPYYWWEAGGVWGALIDYGFFMKNDSLDLMIKEALLYQKGKDDNYVPSNQSMVEGNDDQGFWGLALLEAIEKNFTNPPDSSDGWLGLAQGVFNSMTDRWDSACGGGLRWQIFQWNNGYDYKNSVSNGCLFNIASRLARYTGNDTYMDWAEKVWDWMDDRGILTNGSYILVYDGVYTESCDKVEKGQWTYNQGLMLSGAAYLYNFTLDSMWHERTLKLLEASTPFFENDIMKEAACQPNNDTENCKNDQRSFKAYFARFLGQTSVLVPDTRETIDPWIKASAIGAAKSCTGGYDGNTCGMNWVLGRCDAKYGLGEEVCALEVIQNLLVHDRPAPYTQKHGGSARANPSAGHRPERKGPGPLKITGGDKAGAGIITAVVGVSIVGAGIWLII